MDQAGVDILLVGYRSEAYLPRLLDDIKVCSLLPHALHYWDNIGNPKSLSMAWNDLARQGKKDYICALNPDTVLSPGWDVKLTRALDNVDIGVVHPEQAWMPHDPGRPPSSEWMRDATGDLSNGRVETWDVAHCGIDKLRFFCAMTRRDYWGCLQGVDERLRWWRQDSDLYLRMRHELGKVAAYVIGCPVWHATSASTQEAVARGEIDFEYEKRLSDEFMGRIWSGKIPWWHRLSDEQRAAVRRDRRFARMGIHHPVSRVHHVPKRAT